MTIHVFITEDDDLYRSAIEMAIRAEPDMELVGTARNGFEAVEKLEHNSVKPDVILMDIKMPIMSGIDGIKWIKRRHPGVIILILTTFNDDQYIVEGLAHGADGYLLKRDDFREVLDSIRSAMKGEYILPVEVAAKLTRFMHQKGRSTH